MTNPDSLIEKLEARRVHTGDFGSQCANATLEACIAIVRQHQAEQPSEATMSAILDTLSRFSMSNGGLITWEDGLRALRKRFSIFWKEEAA